jgi:flavodoxin
MGAFYKNLVIYFFSGTGNAKRAAKWIAGVAARLGRNVCLINVDRFVEVEIPKLEDLTLIGFCSPAYGFNLPSNWG